MKRSADCIDHPEVAIEVNCEAAWITHCQRTSGLVRSLSGRDSVREDDLLHRSRVLVCHPSIARAVEHHVSRAIELVRSAVVNGLRRRNSSGDGHPLDSAGGDDPEISVGIEAESLRAVEGGRWGRRAIGSIRRGDAVGKGDPHNCVVVHIGDPEVSVRVECHASWAVETRKDIGGKSGRNAAGKRDLGDRVAQAVRDPEIALAVEDQSVGKIEGVGSGRYIGGCRGCRSIRSRCPEKRHEDQRHTDDKGQADGEGTAPGEMETHE